VAPPALSKALDTAHSQASETASLYLDALTGVRGFAACWVLLYHAWVAAGPENLYLFLGNQRIDVTPFLSGGGLGVTVFFVLSGFLLALPFAQASARGQARPRFPEFFRRRALRVLPAYYAQLLLLIPLLWFGLAPGPAEVANVALHALMAHNFNLHYVATINGPYWSMPTEWNFYLLFPLLILCCGPRRWPWLLAITLLLVPLYRWTLFQYIAAWPLGERVSLIDQLPGRLDQFVFGMLAAHLLVFWRGTPGRRAALARWGDAILALGCLIGLVLLYWMHEHFRRYLAGHWSLYAWNTAFGLATALCILGIAAGGRFGLALFANPVSVWLGVVSYSMYLWHFPVVDALSRQTWIASLPGPHWLPLTLAAVPPILAVSALWYRYVERPFLVPETLAEGPLARLAPLARRRTWLVAALAALGLVTWAAMWQLLRH
jgi:peptidoglycan/LPS O-acetylase OafA/YrhL